MFKIDEKSKKVLVNATRGPTKIYDDYTTSLPNNDYKYIVFDFEYVIVDNCQMTKIFFISRSDNSRIRKKLLYATSKERSRRELDGDHYEVGYLVTSTCWYNLEMS